MFTIRDLASLQDYADCVALQEETWGAGFSERVPTAILRVSQLIGGVTAGAFDADDRMVGFVFGMTGLRNGELVHWSDMLAVQADLRGQGIGERLKRFQRDRILAAGVHTMLWTYDPLQARNAHFNINVLGALPDAYQPDMYGSNTGSSLHGSLPTDRLIVHWDLQSTHHGRGSDLVAPGDASLVLANPLDAEGLPGPSPVEQTPPSGTGYRVQVPADFNTIRVDPDAAMRWRMGLRSVMTALLSHGYRVTGFRRPAGALPYYVLHA